MRMANYTFNGHRKYSKLYDKLFINKMLILDNMK